LTFENGGKHLVEPFISLTATAAPLPIDNVDTDMIWPATSGATMVRGEQARQAFRRLRFAPEGDERPEFILNREPWRNARILIGGDNFGCGSSRELAVWALQEWGIRCVIAPRFGDIFYGNCFINGILPVRLAPKEVDCLMDMAGTPDTAVMTIDLMNCSVTAGSERFWFLAEPRARHGLLHGLDSIGITLAATDRIDAFSQHYLATHPWLRPQVKDFA
jgi:3-isopropylmalate/(R)-2-methylmalate dehydratase small subunit